MPWLKGSDNAATNPMVTSVLGLSDGDQRAINEVFGFVVRCALESASHLTDYVINLGTAYTMGLGRTEELLDLAVRAGMLEEDKFEGQRVWRIVEDADFLHMRSKAEVLWERQRKADNSNPRLTAPVRLRDGDACRYCGSIVNWRARVGRLAGTYDHRNPGAGSETPDDLVVCCGACNAGRKDHADAETQYPLRAAPTEPFYGPDTAAFLTRNGYPTEPTGPGRPAGRASSEPAFLPPEAGFSGDGSGTGRVGTGQDKDVPGPDGTGVVGHAAQLTVVKPTAERQPGPRTHPPPARAAPRTQQPRKRKGRRR